jgi:hypothetical protein
MIPPEIQLKMLKEKALVDDGEKTIINFFLIKQKFPQYLDYLVTYNLNDFELKMYNEGYINYVILEDGYLLWKPTVRGRLLGAQLDLPKSS